MAAGMSKKRAKRLAQSGKLSKAVRWFNKQPYSFEIGLKLTKKTYKGGKKARVEASAKSQYRGGKGRRKFVGFVVAGKNTKIRNAGKNRNKRPWRKVNVLKQLNVGKKFIKKIKLNKKATSKRKKTQIIRKLTRGDSKFAKKLRSLPPKKRRVLRRNRVKKQIRRAAKTPPIVRAKRKVIQRAQRSLRRAKRAAKRTQRGGGRKKAARKVVRRARKVLKRTRKAVRRQNKRKRGKR